MDLLAENLHHLYQLILVGDSDGLFNEIHVRLYVFYADAHESSASRRPVRVKVIRNSRVDGAKHGERMHDNFICSQGKQRCGAIGMEWHKDREFLRELPEDGYKTPG